ncbi:MAG: GntR family transcriptional regulator [Alphaproteobacteria bacterium CG_4_10_14_0_2_um_filter_63_37]|nr:MAG: hypothetical protein AUJ55_05560 [Proteobacteria bacterium CG1_02_64_396]PJA26017.1 MAG: GntR family transcriptional regulator [Alphaproteobacteria bacterium CG_4_10_14_0_2_um_filter_63_37]
MPQIGQYATLKIRSRQGDTLLLDGGSLGDIPLSLIPGAPPLPEAGEVRVFLYHDSEGRPAATTATPRATVGQFAHLKVVSVTPIGAFLDWGLPKDVLLPNKEMPRPVEEGRSVLVFLDLDERDGRIKASARIDRFLDHTPPNYRKGDEVALLVAGKSDLGQKAIVDHLHWGVIHHGDIYRPLKYGQSLKGYIKRARDDGKLDIALQPPGYGKVEELAQEVLKRLASAGGYLPLSDKSDPEAIHAALGVSKKSFKMAIGDLFKRRLIAIEEGGIRRVNTQAGEGQR